VGEESAEINFMFQRKTGNLFKSESNSRNTEDKISASNRGKNEKSRHSFDWYENQWIIRQNKISIWLDKSPGSSILHKQI